MIVTRSSIVASIAMTAGAHPPPILVQRCPAPACEVCVVIPVRDEGALLPGALRALAAQTELDGRPFDCARYEIILLANNCRDDSAAIARDFGSRRPDLVLNIVELELPPNEAHVGRARQLLMDEAQCRLLLIGRPRGIIATTDADTRVAPTWLAAMLREVVLGADGVGGRILTDRRGRASWSRSLWAQYLRDVGYQYLLAELESRLDPEPGDPWPRHFQHTGASFGVTAEAYRRAGGLPALRSSEDLALYRALRRTGARFRHSPVVRVVTSARQRARAFGGMATQLRAWADTAADTSPRLVEPASSLEAQLQARRQLRVLWTHAQSGRPPEPAWVSAVSQSLGLVPGTLSHELARCGVWGEVVDWVEQHHRARPAGFIPIEAAIHGLRVRLAALRRVLPPLQKIEPIALLTLPIQAS